MTKAIETTRFKLMAGYCTADFVAANAGIDLWLKRQPGFRARWITEQEGGVVVDMLLWNSAAQASDAMQRLANELGASPVHAMIDQRSLSWNVLSVCHAVFGAVSS